MSYDDPQPNPFTQRRFITAAVIVAAVVVMALILIFINRDSDTPDATPNPPVTAPNSETLSTRATPSTEDDDSVCGLPPGDQTTPTTPPEATWQLVGTMALPTAKDIGPGITSDEGIHSCYAHNPTGALFAAAGYAVDSWTLPTDQTVGMLRARAVPSDDREAAIKAFETLIESSDSDIPDGYGGEQRFQIAGYQMISVTENSVTIDIVVTKAQVQGHGALTMTMQWHDNDWKVVLLPDGVATHSISTGFTPWAGV